MSKRIQMSRQHPWRDANPDAVIVDRRTPFGNPFKVGEPREVYSAFGAAVVTPESATEAVALFRDWLLSRIETQPATKPSLHYIEEVLRGHDLACWCAPSAACHADVLLDFANADAARQVEIVTEATDALGKRLAALSRSAR